MNHLRSAPLLLAILAAAPLAAQRPGPTTRVDPNALRNAAYTGFGAPVMPSAKTQFALRPQYMGTACTGPGCLVAQGTAGSDPALTVQMGDGSVRGARTTLLVGHGRPHTIRVSLDGSEVMGFSCDGRAIRLRTPGGMPFRWEVYHGQQRVDGGSSTGGPVDVKNPAHAGPGGGPMQLSVQHRNPAELAGASEAWCKKYGCMQLALVHGEHRIVVMPVLQRTTPFAMRDLGVSVSGVPAFAMSGLEVNRGP